MKLTLLSFEKEGYIRLAAEGNITSADFSADGRNPLEAVLGPNWPKLRVMLDLGRTTYVDSSAIGWLINCHKEFKNGGGKIVVHSIPPKVEQVFTLLKIGKVVPLARDEASAKDLLNGV
jgi:anti-anti-sigma factor